MRMNLEKRKFEAYCRGREVAEQGLRCDPIEDKLFSKVVLQGVYSREIIQELCMDFRKGYRQVKMGK